MTNSKLNKTTLITGASGGIGLEIAKIFAKNGHDLILVARSADKLLTIANEFREKYNVKVAAFAKDLSNSDEVISLVEIIKKENVFIDFLVNNAGIGLYGAFESTNWQDDEKMMLLNMNTLAYLCKAFIPEMKKAGRGHVLNIASTAAFQPGPNMAVYFATKAFVLHFSEAINEELKGSGVSVTAVCPGATESGFQKQANMENAALFNKKIPTSAEVAEFAFLAMMQRKAVAIHGFKNKFLVFSTRFAPRSLVTKISKYVMKEN
jgi:short-subunit dehydrogenase